MAETKEEVLHEVARAGEHREMQHAAWQHMGAGMQTGIDLSPAKKYIQQQRADLVAEAESLSPDSWKTESRYPRFIAIRKVET